ncbi:MAG TPA: hypothetical protein VHE35_09565, partial [Kofleriaceae bacterium]|nr:hypothetical protein [Kofleriaceae bacterium]
AAWLVQRVRVIVEPTIRRRAMATILRTSDPAVVVAAANDLVAAAAADDDPDLCGALAALVQACADLDYETRARLYALARAREATHLARVLLDASPPTAEPAQVARQLAPERPLRKQTRPLTLGERKSLARTQRRDVILQMVRDPHPDVVAILLGNPHLTERDVVAMASLRPAVPAALGVIADHPRWSVRAMVRRALAFNPHTPVHVAVRVATTLRPADWRELEADAHASPELVAHVRALLSSAVRARR